MTYRSLQSFGRRRKLLEVWGRGVTEGANEVGIGRDWLGSSLGNARKS